MRTLVPYSIVVPSKGRPDNMKRVLELLPTALIYVDEREAEVYKPFVPKGQLVLHKPMHGLGAVYQGILDDIQTEAVAVIDDDFDALHIVVGQKVRIVRDAKLNQQLIENAVNICKDLGIPLFAWTRQAKPAFFRPYDPIGVVGAVSQAWGMVGRDYKLDKSLVSGSCIDLVLQILVKHRIIYIDRRFYWNCGLVWTGEGGMQGVRTTEQTLADRNKIKHRWRRYVNLDETTDRGSLTMTISVTRKNQMASTRDSLKGTSE